MWLDCRMPTNPVSKPVVPSRLWDTVKSWVKKRSDWTNQPNGTEDGYGGEERWAREQWWEKPTVKFSGSSSKITVKLSPRPPTSGPFSPSHPLSHVVIVSSFSTFHSVLFLIITTERADDKERSEGVRRMSEGTNETNPTTLTYVRWVPFVRFSSLIPLLTLLPLGREHNGNSRW